MASTRRMVGPMRRKIFPTRRRTSSTPTTRWMRIRRLHRRNSHLMRTEIVSRTRLAGRMTEFRSWQAVATEVATEVAMGVVMEAMEGATEATEATEAVVVTAVVIR